MIDEDAHDDEMEMYGPWPWLVGIGFGIFITVVMFVLSDGFS